MTLRINNCFETLKLANKKALIAFLTAGDPNYELSLELIKSLPEAGADIIEIGMPFSDPMADGPSIQASSLRAINSGHKMEKTFEMIESFRKDNSHTPIILMGYFNPIYNYGVDSFIKKIIDIEVDGVIVVDLPPEEDNELCNAIESADLSFIRLVTPTTNADRLNKILQKTSGFLYYVSIAGITGSKRPEINEVETAVQEIKTKTSIPIGVGFGIRTKEDIERVGSFADGVIVGSVLVDIIKNNEHESSVKDKIMKKVREFASAV